MTRKEYQQQYYLQHKKERQVYFQTLYKEDKNKRLTYAKKHYILNRNMILLKAKLGHTDFKGRAHDIWVSLRKYAKKWQIPISDWSDFKSWSMSDSGYENVYNQWKDENFNKEFSPVVMRNVKKNGFVVGNIYWDYREKYSWWSKELETIQKVEKETDDYQRKNNKRGKDWQDKVKEQWKNRKKK